MYSPVFELTSFDTMPIDYRCSVLQGMLEALVIANRTYLKLNPNTAPMYTYALRYKMKVRPFGLDTWQDIPRTIALEGGDCKDFSCWRVAELRDSGIRDVSPFIKVSSQGGLVVYHIQVRCGLQIEDPSVNLGMSNMTSDEVRGLIQGPTNGVEGVQAMQQTAMMQARGMRIVR